MAKIVVPQKWDEYQKLEIDAAGEYVSDFPANELGVEAYDEITGNTYKFVKTHTTLTNDTTAANEVMLFEATATGASLGVTVTNAAAAANIPNFAGISLGAVPKSTTTYVYFCWVKKSGKVTAKTDNGVDIVAGSLLVPDLGVAGAFDVMVAGEEALVCATALAAQAASKVTALLRTR